MSEQVKPEPYPRKTNRQPKPATDAEREKWALMSMPLAMMNARIDQERAARESAEESASEYGPELAAAESVCVDLRKRIAELEQENAELRETLRLTENATLAADLYRATKALESVVEMSDGNLAIDREEFEAYKAGKPKEDAT